MEIFYAIFIGNSILVTELNYPRIFQLTNELKQRLDVDKTIDVFVYEQGTFNAYMRRLFFRRAVFLNSEVLESGVSDDEVRWVVGRFVGYWRAQKDAGLAGWLIRMTERLGVFNLLIFPYERALVYTGDRLGLAVIGGDISTALAAMQKLLVGRQLGYSVNPLGLIDQHRRVKGFIFPFLARVPIPYPHTTARYVDMLAFAKRTYPEPFSRFYAANPGLPDDVQQLSSEQGSLASIVRGLGALLLLFVLLVLSLAIVAGVDRPLLIRFMPHPSDGDIDSSAAFNPSSTDPNTSATAPADTSSPPATTSDSSAAPADGTTTDQTTTSDQNNSSQTSGTQSSTDNPPPPPPPQ
jgi:hypothetical protein